MNEVTPIIGCHHVALRCKDAQETVEFYTNILGMRLTIATREVGHRDTGAADFIHVFLETRDGNFVAFFDVPSLPMTGARMEAPFGSPKFRFQVDSPAIVDQIRQRIELYGTPVERPVLRGPFKAISFRDPNGYSLEIMSSGESVVDTSPGDDAWDILGEWALQKRNGLLG